MNIIQKLFSALGGIVQLIQAGQLDLVHFLCSVAITKPMIRLWMQHADLALGDLLLLGRGLTVALADALLSIVGLSLALLLVLLFVLALLIGICRAAGILALLLECEVAWGFQHGFGGGVTMRLHRHFEDGLDLFGPCAVGQ